MKRPLGLVLALLFIITLVACNTNTPPPDITSFTAAPASIAPGSSATLSWTLQGSGSPTLLIDNGVGNVTGESQVTVNPSVTTTYTLLAVNSGGTVSSTAVVTVTGTSTQHTLSLSGSNGSVKVNGTPQSLPYSGSFPDGTSVSVEAVPDSGYQFSGWSGALSGSTNPTSITMNGDKSVTATFSVAGGTSHSLSVTGSNGSVKVNGTAQSLPYSGSFPDGTSVSVEAVPDSGYQFSGWSGALSGSTNPTSITMNGDKSVSASFTVVSNAGPYTLSLSGTNGSVKVNGTSQALPYSTTFSSGTSVSLEAVPDSGYTFGGWGGDLSGASTSTSITMDADKNVTLAFATQSKPYVLTLNGSHGSVNVNGASHTLPYSETFASGASVSLQALPDTHYQFDGWGGDLSGTSASTSVTMSASKTVSVNFSPIMHTLSITGSHGSVKVNGTSQSLPYSGSFAEGTSVSLQAVPASGYQFAGWSGGLSGSTNPTSITMDAAHSVTATFSIKQYTLSLGGSNGSVKVNGTSHSLPYSAMFPSGTSVSLQAVPDSGYDFTGWGGDLSGTSLSTSITMNADKSVTVGFALPLHYTLSLNGSHGSVSVNGSSHTLPYSGSFASGTSVSLRAIPDAHYKFDAWGGDLSGTSTSTSITMNAGKSVTASFSPIMHTLSITGSNGRVNVNGTAQNLPYTGSFAEGTSLSLQALPDTHYRFDGWGGDLSGTSASTSVTMSAAKNVTAGFSKIMHTLSITGSNGSVKVNGTSQSLSYTGSFAEGTSVSLQAVPASGYQFDSWGGNLSGTSASTSITMDTDKSVTASFTAKKPVISSFSASPNSLSYSGGNTTLSWNASNASSYSVSVSPTMSGFPKTTAGSSLNVSLPANNNTNAINYTFTLIATGPGGTDTATTSVAVGAPPQVTIQSFSLSPTSLSGSGGSVTASWSASNATSYRLTSSPALPGLPKTTGGTSTSFSVPQNTSASAKSYTITLTATGPANTASLQRTLTQSAPPVIISSFTASPGGLSYSGGTVTLSWSATGASSYQVSSSIAISGLPRTTGSTSISVSVPSNTSISGRTITFQLSASGGGGSDSASTSVSQSGKPRPNPPGSVNNYAVAAPYAFHYKGIGACGFANDYGVLGTISGGATVGPSTGTHRWACITFAASTSSGIQAYHIVRRSSSTGAGQSVATLSATSSSMMAVDANPGTTPYEYGVYATDSSGTASQTAWSGYMTAPPSGLMGLQLTKGTLQGSITDESNTSPALLSSTRNVKYNFSNPWPSAPTTMFDVELYEIQWNEFYGQWGTTLNHNQQVDVSSGFNWGVPKDTPNVISVYDYHWRTLVIGYAYRYTSGGPVTGVDIGQTVRFTVSNGISAGSSAWGTADLPPGLVGY